MSLAETFFTKEKKKFAGILQTVSEPAIKSGRVSLAEFLGKPEPKTSEFLIKKTESLNEQQ